MRDFRNVTPFTVALIMIVSMIGCFDNIPPGYVKITIKGMGNLPNQVIMRTHGSDTLKMIVHNNVIEALTNWNAFPITFLFDTNSSNTMVLKSQQDTTDFDWDNDGIPNLQDACPLEPGLASDNPSLNGCPESQEDTTMADGSYQLKIGQCVDPTLAAGVMDSTIDKKR